MSATTAITFKTYDGLLLSGSLYDAGKARPTIIMTNGVSYPFFNPVLPSSLLRST